MKSTHFTVYVIAFAALCSSIPTRDLVSSNHKVLTTARRETLLERALHDDLAIREALDPSTCDYNKFFAACSNGNLENVKKCLQAGVDPAIGGNYATELASYYGHSKVVELLLKDDRVDPSADDNFAIRLASGQGHSEVVKLLLTDRRVDPSADDNFAIQWSSLKGHSEVVKLLLKDHRVDPSSRDNFAIKWASQNGQSDVVDLLLKDRRVDPLVAAQIPELKKLSERIKTIFIQPLAYRYAESSPEMQHVRHQFSQSVKSAQGVDLAVFNRLVLDGNKLAIEQYLAKLARTFLDMSKDQPAKFEVQQVGGQN